MAAQPPPDYPDWLDPKTVEWCASRCGAISARAIGKARFDYHGALTCSRHLASIARELAPPNLPAVIP